MEEIFEALCTHLKEGVCYHEELEKAFCFLGLYELAEIQKEHYNDELKKYRDMVCYYITNHFKLLKIETEKKEVIPENWYKYTTQQVDNGTRQNAIKELITKWIEWEKDTKKLYEDLYLKLTNLREVAEAIKLEKLIKDVNKELGEAQRLLIKLETINYDLTVIVKWQNK